MSASGSVAQLSWFQIFLAKSDIQSVILAKETLILLSILGFSWFLFFINLAVGAAAGIFSCMFL